MRVEQLDAAADGSSHDAADHIDGPGESDSNMRRTIGVLIRRAREPEIVSRVARRPYGVRQMV
jgi:hypothetical protein